MTPQEFVQSIQNKHPEMFDLVRACDVILQLEAQLQQALHQNAELVQKEPVTAEEDDDG